MLDGAAAGQEDVAVEALAVGLRAEFRAQVPGVAATVCFGGGGSWVHDLTRASIAILV